MEATRPLTTEPRHPDGRPQRAETHKHVTVATTSSYMSEQRYVMRKPLFSDQHHTSILKTPRPPRRSEENPPGPSDRGGTRMTRMSRSSSLSHSDPEVTEDSDSVLKSSELRGWGELDEPPPPFCVTSSASGWTPPLSPQLTSTVLHPINTPCSGRSRKSPAVSGLEKWGGRGEGKTTCCPGLSKSSGQSTHQDNYWACAIPRTSVPASDRRSSSWDPNRAYEALLDYSYPLRPGQGVSQSDVSGFEGDSCLQDSGIGLDHVDGSVSPPGPIGRERSQRSPDPRGVGASGVRPRLRDGLDRSEDGGGRRRDPRAGLCSPTSTRFPRPRCFCREVDEEFWALPDHLGVLRPTSTQGREATAEVSRPLIGSQERVAPSSSSSSLLGSEADSVGATEDDWQRYEDGAMTEQRAAGGTSRIRPRPSPLVAGAPAGSGKLETDAMGQKDDWERRDQNDSLMQHIQVFCSHLKLLIQQLYALSERMQRLSAPPVDVDGVTSAVVDYLSFQSEVSGQQPLSDCVLHTGRLLLSSIDTASPMLRDTLRLIERRSGELQSHARLFLSSSLSAAVPQSRDDLLQTG